MADRKHTVPADWSCEMLWQSLVGRMAILAEGYPQHVSQGRMEMDAALWRECRCVLRDRARKDLQLGATTIKADQAVPIYARCETRPNWLGGGGTLLWRTDDVVSGLTHRPWTERWRRTHSTPFSPPPIWQLSFFD